MKKIIISLLLAQSVCFSQVVDTVWSDNKIVLSGAAHLYINIPDSTYVISPELNLEFILKRKDIKILKSEETPVLLTQIKNLDSMISSTHYYSNLKVFHIDSFTKPQGRWFHQSIFYDNGQLYFSAHVPDTIPHTITSYYRNGNKQRVHTNIMGALTGEVKEWHSNGNLKIAGQYKAIPEKHYHRVNNTKKTGSWIYYNKDGSIYKNEEYIDGILQK